MFSTAQLPWKDLLGQPLDRDHVVQLYRDERVLVDAVSLFAGTALGRGESVVLVATPEHLDAVERRLADGGFELADLKQWGQLTVRNAAELLYGFMVDGRPDPLLFKALVGGMLRDVAARGNKVRVYGEMVNLLWRDNVGAAAQLESLWNELIRDEGISLFCAYQLDDTARGSVFPSSLSHAHSHLIPVEAIA
jgi:MEDS: MEthanogen/methylotroph, DcmR Sensory domain